jgi:cyclopropane fatty-acyl-phospholipid synthase-like methyltransferase
MLNSEIIKNNIFRYNFFKNILNGNVFDHQSNTFTTYNSAKILLENNVTEVYSCNDESIKEFNLRKKDNNKNISFITINNKNFDSYFDNIISFENLNQENFSKYIETYFKFLKNHGTLIIAVLNKKYKNFNKIQSMNEFSIEDLRNKLNSKFKIIDIYSQRFIEKSHITQRNSFSKNLRMKLANILKKIDKNRHLYIKYIQKNMSKIDSFKANIEKIPDEDFIPKKYDEKIQPLFLIIVCKKYQDTKNR